MPDVSPWARIRRKAGRIRRYAGMWRDYRIARRDAALPVPIFIVCQNRTGSTFLNRLFGHHPQCWTYRLGSHQEAMDHEDCPRWLSRQPFVRRWQVKRPPPSERFQTPLWLAHMARGYPFGVFKVPHYLAKVLALQEIVPQARFVLLLRNPAAQITSALATRNTRTYIRAVADATEYFLVHERDQVRNLTTVRYEDLTECPHETFAALCRSLGMASDTDVVANCIDQVGIVPGREPEDCTVPDWAAVHVKRLCQLMGYPEPAVPDLRTPIPT